MMTISRIRRIAYHFHGITVIVPDQFNQPNLVAIDMGSLVPNPIPDTNDFTLIRLIANIALLTWEDYGNGNIIPVSTFDPPIEFRVNYNCLDVFRSGGDIRNLKLAYWHIEDKHWVILSDDPHEYLILPPSTGQVAEVKIWSWEGDPPIAWVT